MFRVTEGQRSLLRASQDQNMPPFAIKSRQSPRISPYLSAAQRAKGFRFRRRDESVTPALEGYQDGSATVRSPSPLYAAPKAAQALWTNAKYGLRPLIDCRTSSLRVFRPLPEHPRVS